MASKIALVAREFAWLEPERESLFSPASGSIISRIFPTVFLEVRDTLSSSVVLASLDVRDAFLTVEQECPTFVHTTKNGALHWDGCFQVKGMEVCCSIVPSLHS